MTGEDSIADEEWDLQERRADDGGEEQHCRVPTYFANHGFKCRTVPVYLSSARCRDLRERCALTRDLTSTVGEQREESEMPCVFDVLVGSMQMLFRVVAYVLIKYLRHASPILRAYSFEYAPEDKLGCTSSVAAGRPLG